MSAVFLSASIPDPKRNPKYAESADTIAISAAVSALMYVVLGRRRLIWGGHPAITPMIWVMAESMGIDYANWVTLYQSNFFEDQFPEDNEKFKNVVITKAINSNRDDSLNEMRQRMINDNQFSAAVFIGGMEGIVSEYKIFHASHDNAKLLPIISTGGATLEIPALMQQTAMPSDYTYNYDYVEVFHNHLNISPKEQRYHTPEMQPHNLEDRFFK